jgi:hypothetical protein
MTDEPLDAESLNELIATLPEEAKRYLRMCLEGVVRCFMDDSTQVGVLVVANTDVYGMHVYSMGIDDNDTNNLLTAVIMNKAAENAAMNTPKEKLN